MNRLIGLRRASPAILVALLHAVVTAAIAGPPAPDNKAALAGVKEMKIAFDVTESNPRVLLAKLKTIDLTRRQLVAEGVKPHIVIAFRGNASYFTQSDLSKVSADDREAAEQVAAKLKEMRSATGVEAIEQCAVPLAPRKLRHEDVIPEVTVVGNGWISLVAYQQKGYAYIAP